MSSVRVPVISDNIVEGSERFNLLLTVPSSLARAIRAGNRNTAVGVITDSTSKHEMMQKLLFYCVITNC